MTAEVMFV